MIFQRADIRARGRGRGQRAHYFAPGQVLRVKHAAMAMPAFLAEIVFKLVVVRTAGLDAREASAEADQLAHCLGTFAHDRLDRGAIAQAGARADRVVDMRFERIVHAPHARNAALRVRGVGLGAAGLCEHGDGANLGRLEGEGQACDAAADYQEVAEQLCVMPHQDGLSLGPQMNRGERCVNLTLLGLRAASQGESRGRDLPPQADSNNLEGADRNERTEDSSKG